MDLSLELSGIPEPVRAFANHAVEQQTPVVIAGHEALLGNPDHPIRQFDNCADLHIGIIFHRPNTSCA
jgi:hypothetical protein